MSEWKLIHSLTLVATPQPKPAVIDRRYREAGVARAEQPIGLVALILKPALDRFCNGR